MSAAWTVAGVRWAVAGVLGPPVVSPCRATGVINGAPTFGVVATGGWPQVVDAGRVVAGCWVRLWFRPAGLSWCRRVVGAPFMTPVAARRRQDVGRTDSRGVLGEPPRACSVSVPVFPAAASVLAAAASVGSGAAAVWTSGLSAEGWMEGYGRGSEVHILLYITGVRGKDMCISAR